MCIKFVTTITHSLQLIHAFRYGIQMSQETRRLVIAVWQNIVVNEYLPVLLGAIKHSEYQLGSRMGGTYTNVH